MARRYGFIKLLEVVKDRVPVQDLARRYTELEPLGGRAWFTGRCPAPDHEDKTPSFFIYPPGRWWCYGCSRGGDVLDLYELVQGYADPKLALIDLASEYGCFEDSRLARPESWHRRQARQAPIRSAIDGAKFRHVRERLYATFFRPMLAAVEDDEDRRHAERELWRATDLLARHVFSGVMKGSGGG